jgi:hypothetical protein
MWIGLLIATLTIGLVAALRSRRQPRDIVEEFIAAGWLKLVACATPQTRALLMAQAIAESPRTLPSVYWAPEVRQSAHHKDRIARYRALWNQVFVWCEEAERGRELTSAEACNIRAVLWAHVAQVLRRNDSPYIAPE